MLELMLAILHRIGALYCSCKEINTFNLNTYVMGRVIYPVLTY